LGAALSPREGEDRLTDEVVRLVRRRFGVLAAAPCRVSDVELTAAERELGARLPASYRAFLRHFGSSLLCRVRFHGFVRDRLRSDLVLVNQIATAPHPAHYVQFGKDRAGRCYYLDTARPDGVGECPVVMRDPSGAEREIADSFLSFLRQGGRGGFATMNGADGGASSHLAPPASAS
jgi:hypothetical protein